MNETAIITAIETVKQRLSEIEFAVNHLRRELGRIEQRVATLEFKQRKDRAESNQCQTNTP